jgi:hypothetical protein
MRTQLVRWLRRASIIVGELRVALAALADVARVDAVLGQSASRAVAGTGSAGVWPL